MLFILTTELFCCAAPANGACACSIVVSLSCPMTSTFSPHVRADCSVVVNVWTPLGIVMVLTGGMVWPAVPGGLCSKNPPGGLLFVYIIIHFTIYPASSYTVSYLRRIHGLKVATSVKIFSHLTITISLNCLIVEHPYRGVKPVGIISLK